jgi:hypothetical protein
MSVISFNCKHIHFIFFNFKFQRKSKYEIFKRSASTEAKKEKIEAKCAINYRSNESKKSTCPIIVQHYFIAFVPYSSMVSKQLSHAVHHFLVLLVLPRLLIIQHDT